ncbi:hypothetical protein ACFV7R_35145 [Streptomyces sp. NPDC059866]|uniref:hypothetical protein n=1 Tax=Streptomyces sp. NPDC059866 TaxID=3346978 RepID=UPI00366496B8
MAREITRRLYLLHTQAVQQATELAVQQEAEENDRRAVAEAVARALPGARALPVARVEEQHRRTRVDSVCAIIGPSGEWVQVEASGRPDSVIPLLAAFSQTPRE